LLCFFSQTSSVSLRCTVESPPDRLSTFRLLDFTSFQEETVSFSLLFASQFRYRSHSALLSFPPLAAFKTVCYSFHPLREFRRRCFHSCDRPDPRLAIGPDMGIPKALGQPSFGFLLFGVSWAFERGCLRVRWSKIWLPWGVIPGWFSSPSNIFWFSRLMLGDVLFAMSRWNPAQPLAPNPGFVSPAF